MHLNRYFFFSPKRTAEVQKEIVPVEVLLIYLNSKGWNKFPCHCQKRRIWDAFTLSLALATLLRQDPVPGEGVFSSEAPGKLKLHFCVSYFSCFQSTGCTTNPAQLRKFNWCQPKQLQHSWCWPWTHLLVSFIALILPHVTSPPGDLFIPSCCHTLIYAIAADGRVLPGCSVPGALYSVAKVITSSREQEVNSRLFSSAWTKH